MGKLSGKHRIRSLLQEFVSHLNDNWALSCYTINRIHTAINLMSVFISIVMHFVIAFQMHTNHSFVVRNFVFIFFSLSLSLSLHLINGNVGDFFSGKIKGIQNVYNRILFYLSHTWRPLLVSFFRSILVWQCESNSQLRLMTWNESHKLLSYSSALAKEENRTHTFFLFHWCQLPLLSCCSLFLKLHTLFTFAF